MIFKDLQFLKRTSPEEVAKMVDVEELLHLPEKPERTIRFFKKGGMYYAVGKDAEIIATQHIRSIGSLKDGRGGKYVNISESLYASLLRDLLLYNHTSIELWEYDGDWQLEIEASPGNVMPVIDIINADLDYSAQSSLLAIAVKEASSVVTIEAAICDPTLYTIATTEFIETQSFCHFENLLTQTMPSEIIIAALPKVYERKLTTIIDKFGIPYKNAGNVKTVDVGDLPNNLAVKALLSMLKLTLSEFKHRPFTLSQFMTVDYSAANALKLFPDGPQTRGLPTSLYQLLNICVTPMGSRLLQQAMQQPKRDADEINHSLDLVQAFAENADVRMQARSVMKQLPDIARLMRKFTNDRANLMDCVRLFDVSGVVEKFAFLSEASVPEFEEFVSKITECAVEAEKVKTLVEQTIDFNLIPQHIYRIMPEFDESLQETANEIEEVKAKMEAKRRKIASNIGIDQEKLKLERSTNQRSFYFRLPSSLSKTIRGDSSLIITDARRDGVHFTCKSLNEMTERMADLEQSYSEKQRTIQKRLIETLKEYAPVFMELCDTFALIDFYSALGEVAMMNDYVRPTISQGGQSLELRQARHPLLEKHVQTFIANDVTMKHGESSFIIISGPNSAGKSTLLKTVGLCVYMAHMGSFVPCSEAVIPIMPSIHARVGAWDSIHQSTFTHEMTEMASIMESASPASLVIVDELGRSTSCSDGFGLAWAISEALATKIGSFTLFATHFHELCKLEEDIPCVTNYHMEADVEDRLRMKFTFVPGPFGDSFGIEAAERAGFPSEVIKTAREKLKELEIIDKEGDATVVRHQVLDMNIPYLKLLRQFKRIDLKSTSPEELVTLATNALAQFMEDKRNNTFVEQN